MMKWAMQEVVMTKPNHYKITVGNTPQLKKIVEEHIVETSKTVTKCLFNVKTHED